MSSSRTRTLVLPLIALSLMAAACGDAVGGEPTPSPETTTAAAAESSTTATPSTSGAPSTSTPTTTAAPTTTTSGLQETPPVAITGEPLPDVADSGEDLAVGLTAPQIVGFDFAGNEVMLGGGDAPQAIMFVAHWCSHCQAEVPAVQAWVEETGGVEGVEIIAVSTAVVPERSNYPPSEWFLAEAWSSQVLADDKDASSFVAYGGRAIPFWVFVDGAGKVHHRIEGGVDLITLESAMNDLAATG